MCALSSKGGIFIVKFISNSPKHFQFMSYLTLVCFSLRKAFICKDLNPVSPGVRRDFKLKESKRTCTISLSNQRPKQAKEMNFPTLRLRGFPYWNGGGGYVSEVGVPSVLCEQNGWQSYLSVGFFFCLCLLGALMTVWAGAYGGDFQKWVRYPSRNIQYQFDDAASSWACKENPV